jgi:hypothetical protein
MPRVAFGEPTWIAEVLNRIRCRIADKTPINASCVFAYAGNPLDLLKHPPMDQFVSTWVSTMPPDPRSVAGGGAANTVFNSTLRIDAFCRVGLDREYEDTNFLENSSFGMGEFVRKVVRSVQVWPAIDKTDKSIFVEPPRLADRGVTFNPRTPPSGWGWAEILLSAKFRADLSLPPPPVPPPPPPPLSGTISQIVDDGQALLINVGNHGLFTTDVIRISGTSNATYNGQTFTVISVPALDAVYLDIDFGASTGGSWVKVG